jgi:hypothetical protein
MRAALIVAAVLAIGLVLPHTARAQHDGGGWHGGGWHGGGWWWAPAAAAGVFAGAALAYPYAYGYPDPYAYPYPPPAYYPPQASAYYPPQAPVNYPAPPPAAAAPAAATESSAAITYTNRPAFKNSAGQTCREFQAASGAIGSACEDSSGQWRVAN